MQRARESLAPNFPRALRGHLGARQTRPPAHAGRKGPIMASSLVPVGTFSYTKEEASLLKFCVVRPTRDGLKVKSGQVSLEEAIDRALSLSPGAWICAYAANAPRKKRGKGVTYTHGTNALKKLAVTS